MRLFCSTRRVGRLALLVGVLVAASLAQAQEAQFPPTSPPQADTPPLAPGVPPFAPDAPGTPPLVPGASPGGPLVGTWQTEIPNPGGPPMTGVVTYRPDGTYRETLEIQGETVGYWMGVYQLSPDGTLMLNETETSPQLCFQGQCQPNEGPTQTVARIVAMDPSSYSASYQDGQTSMTLTFQRVGGLESGGGSSATPWAPPQPEAAPRMDPRRPPDTGAALPVGWSGSWSDGEIAIHISPDGGSVLEVDGVPYPLTLAGDEARLEGTFQSGGESFEIVLERTAGGLLVESGGSSFALAPMSPPNPGPPGNPLAN